jgi:anti-sigma factor RsiW
MAQTTDDRFAADPWTDRLSEYLDDELSPAERGALEAHLGGCEECTATLEGLRRVTVRARALGDRPPARDLWPAIAASLVEPKELRFRSPRRLSVPVPALAAAAVAFLVIGASMVWLLRSPGGITGGPAPVAVNPAPTVSPAGIGRASLRYDAAVAELQQVLDQGRSRLKPETVKVLEQKLALIDRAIVDAQEALAKDPASVYLNDHLAETRLRKLELLRRAAALAASAS